MVTLTAMYDGQANSPPALLTSEITNSATSIAVDDSSILPAAPTWMTLGADTEEAETVKLTNKVGNTLTVTRGQQGTTAKAWGIGTKVQRCFTAEDHNVLIDNIEALNTGKAEASHAATHKTAGDDAISPADIGAQAAITASGILKGSGSAVSAATAGTDYLAPVTTGSKVQLYGVNASNTQAMYELDTDLSSVSANDDTIPSAKATKTMGDAKVTKITSGDKIQLYGVNASNAQTMYELGAASSVASLDSNSKVTASQAAARIVDVSDNKTLALADAGTMQRFTSASNYTLTVPPNSAVAFPVGTEIEVTRYSTGTVTIAAGSGVTINKNGTALTIKNQYTSIYLKKIATDEWLLQGNLG